MARPDILKIRAEQTSQSAGDARLRNMRYKIVQLAETNARMRAIFGQGIRMSYTKEELEQKFFICAQPVITGRSSNPAVEEIFAKAVASNLAPNTALLYGSQVPPIPAAAALALSEPSEIKPAAEQLSPTEKAVIEAQAEPTGWIIPFGVHKDKPIDHQDITEEVLGRLIDYCVGALEDENQAANVPFYTECRSQIEKEITKRHLTQGTGSIDEAATTTGVEATGIKL
jgi:hypothetical protein